MSKDLFIAAHEELVEQYLLDHPDADWSEAYDKTADTAGDRYRDKFADIVDAAPDMLAALKEMVIWMPSGFAPQSQAKAMQMAHAAIAKAEGRA